jgi:hypothetical protein
MARKRSQSEHLVGGQADRVLEALRLRPSCSGAPSLVAIADPITLRLQLRVASSLHPSHRTQPLRRQNSSFFIENSFRVACRGLSI